MTAHAPATTLPDAAPGGQTTAAIEDIEETWLGLSPYWSFRLQALFRGLPAFFGFFTVLGVSLFGMVNQQKVEAEYQTLAYSAMQSKEYRLAELCLERTIDLGNDTQQARYQLAMALWQRGKHGRAKSTLDELAPREGKGYAPAHFWMARFELAVGKNSKKAQETAEAHLIRAIEIDETMRPAQLMLFQLYAMQKNYHTAEDFMKRADNIEPIDQMTKAKFYRVWSGALEKKDPKGSASYEERAQVEATRAAESIGLWLKQDPENHRYRIQLAKIHMFLEQPEKAIALLIEGKKRRPSAIYARLLSNAHYAWALKTKDAAKKVERLILALTHDRDNSIVYPELIAALDDKKTAKQVTSALQELIVDARGNRAFLHLLLGNLARSRGDLKNAELHFGQGIQAGGPAAALVANNFALHLAMQKKPEFDRALELIASALKQYPKNPRLRDTRGRVYLKMGRLKDALSDLEFAAADGRIRDLKGLHQALGDTYTGLGNKDMAKKHFKKVQLIEFREAEYKKKQAKQRGAYNFGLPEKSGSGSGSGTKPAKKKKTGSGS